MPFEQLGPYKIGERLGRGGMGTVYAAQHVDTGERVAVKVLAESLAHENGFRERFAVEIESLRQLRHPNIVELYGFGEQEGTLFYSMELVVGPSLDELIRSGRTFSWGEATDLSVQICRALKHAHDRGVVHRDLKPANLLIPANGHLKLADFGISKFFGATNLTAAGGLLGTADYMAPEQADGRPVTHRCDLYSLGGVMYAMLAGRPPFIAGNVVEMLQLQRFAEPEPLRKFAPGVPAELEEIVSRLLQKDPEARIPTATSLLRRLEAMRLGIPSRESDDPPVRSEPAAPSAPAPPPTEVSDTSPPNAGTPPASNAAPSAATGAGQPKPAETTAHEEYVIASLVGPGPAVDAYRAARADFNLASDLALGNRSKPVAPETQASAASPPVANSSSAATSAHAPVVVASAASSGPASARQSEGPAVTRYTDVADETPPWQDLISDVRSPWKSPQTWVLIGALAAVAYLGWRFLKPLSADQLYERISTAAAGGKNDDLAAVSDEIDQFVRRFPDDDRIGEVSEYQRQVMDLRTQRRSGKRGASSRHEKPSPVEQSYAEAIRLSESDPEAARRKLQAIVDLYDGAGEAADVVEVVADARQALDRLDVETAELNSRRVALVEKALDRADNLAADDVAAARKLWRGVVELYEEKTWAADLVARAKQGLKAHPDDGAK